MSFSVLSTLPLKWTASEREIDIISLLFHDPLVHVVQEHSVTLLFLKIGVRSVCVCVCVGQTDNIYMYQ
jgi:hypothetical protein